MKKMSPFNVMLAIITMSFIFASPAFSSDKIRCNINPEAQQMPLSSFFSQLEKEGYRVKEFDRDNHCYKIEGVAPDGQRVKAYFDTASGKLVHRRPDN